MSNNFSIAILLIPLSFCAFITIPFTTEHNDYLTNKTFEWKKPMNFITTKISLGTPAKTFKINIESQINSLIILSSLCNNVTENTFNTIESSTYSKGENKTVIIKEPDIEDIVIVANYSGSESNETFIISNNKLDNFTFFLVDYNEFPITFPFYSGILGLGLVTSFTDKNSKSFFIRELKEHKLIDKEILFIQYDKENEGKIIFGALPHIYDSKKFKSEDIISSNVYINSGEGFWGLKFDEISYGNITYSGRLISSFSIETGGILAPGAFYDNILQQQFFGEYIDKKLCIPFSISNYYSYFCNDTIDFKSFKTINFYNKVLNYTFSFNADDLFYSSEGKRYFQIYFIDNEEELLSEEQWVLGKPFFKKTVLTFDIDKKQINIYVKIQSDSKFNFVWIIVIICVLIIIGLIYFIYATRIKNKKKKAIELDEYDYTPMNK